MSNAKRNKKLLVFLSYASEDRDKVRKLCKQLREDGFDPWLDEERLLPGQDWSLEIEKALRASNAILLCFSTLSISKEGYIQREYKRAMRVQEEKPEGIIFVIPVRLDNCEMPFFIRELQWVDYPTGYDRLLLSLQIKSGNSEIPKKQISKEPKQVQIVLEGDFDNFDKVKQQDLIGVLAVILHVDSENIRVLQVYSGSIIILLDLPETAAYRLQELALNRDFRLKAKKILSIQVEGEKIVYLSKDQRMKEEDTQRQEVIGNVTNIYIGGDVNGSNIISGNNNMVTQSIQNSFNKAEAADIQAELKKTLKMLADAVAVMAKSLPAEQATETTDDLSKLVDEATQPKPNKKWYSVSIDGLIKAAENVEQVGEPVINLSRKVLSLLTGGVIK